MEQLSLTSESPKIQPQSNQLGNTNRVLALVLLISPLLLFLLFVIYYLVTLSDAISAFTSALALLIVFLLTYFIITSLASLGQSLFSLQIARHNVISRRFNSRFTLVDSPKTQPISIVLWVRNQGYGLTETVKALLALNYPDYEIIIINDGSTDNTMEVLEIEFGLQPLNRIFRRSLPASSITATYTSPKYPIITVVEKPHTGRADCLNIGVNLAKAPLICIVEPNHLLTRDALLLLAKPFIEYPSTTIMTVGLGEKRVNIEDVSLRENLQVIERKHFFHSSLIIRDNFCLVTANNNAVKLVKKTELIEIGGFSDSDLSDLTLNLKIQQLLSGKKQNYRFSYIPDVLCWENNLAEPQNAFELHSNWQASVLRAAISNIKLLFKLTSKQSFLASCLLILETLNPILTLLGIVLAPIAFLIGAISLELTVLYFIAFITFSLLVSLSGIIADEFSLRYQHSLAEIVNLVLASLVESLFYQPFVKFWRVLGALRTLLS